MTKQAMSSFEEGTHYARFVAWATLYSRHPVRWLKATPRANHRIAREGDRVVTTAEILRTRAFDARRLATMETLGPLLDGLDLHGTPLGESLLRAVQVPSFSERATRTGGRPPLDRDFAKLELASDSV